MTCEHGPLLQLTWAGLDAAVDVIAAQCPRDRRGVCGMDRGGRVLAWALAERLAPPYAARPTNGALPVWGMVERAPRTRCADASIWARVDMTARHRVESVMKVTAGAVVLMPWQNAPTLYQRSLVPGLND